MLKLQILFVGVSVGISLIVTYFFGFMIGSVLNIVMLFGLIYYIRRKQEFGSSSLFGFSDKSPSFSSPSSSSSRISSNSSITNTDRNIKYVCLTCSTKVTGRTCRKCGSHMKKPVF
jgi:ribosomal protein L40E